MGTSDEHYALQLRLRGGRLSDVLVIRDNNPYACPQEFSSFCSVHYGAGLQPEGLACRWFLLPEYPAFRSCFLRSITWMRKNGFCCRFLLGACCASVELQLCASFSQSAHGSQVDGHRQVLRDQHGPSFILANTAVSSI